MPHKNLPGEMIGDKNRLSIDAGVETLRLYVTDADKQVVDFREFASNDGVEVLLDILEEHPETPLLLTGRLQSTLKNRIGRGDELDRYAVLWEAARYRDPGQSTVVIDLSASGYAVVGVTLQGTLRDDLLVTSPRCGAGPGLNIDRVLQKLGIAREQVDSLLASMLGQDGAAARAEIPVRADRCGVFASSATISDKNQGLPLDFALATTLKSEVLKACKQVTTCFDTVWLTGGVFRWQFCRDCAYDYFQALGVSSVCHDSDQTLMLDGMVQLAEHAVVQNAGIKPVADRDASPQVLPGFTEIHNNLQTRQLFYRETGGDGFSHSGDARQNDAVSLGIDIGSTMAKLVVQSHPSGETVYKGVVSNAGDTIETLKALFRDMSQQGFDALPIRQIGLTGSARYQVRQALIATYPELADRIVVQVENYAHALGSIANARRHLRRLSDAGVRNVNREVCVVVDVGGEDTKITTVSLADETLIDNAMNNKCSAGTGSLLDTLGALFRISDIEEVSQTACLAPRAFNINATCAVYLLEHARRLQAEGRRQDEILASAVWAIAENMARSLWSQIRLPAHAIVLLHGQTMASDPIPLAVTRRLQGFLGVPAYCLVPPDPGFRACFGLLQSMTGEAAAKPITIDLSALLEKTFARQIVSCQGAVCGDPEAHCYRSQVTTLDGCGHSLRFGLGGCNAIQEWSMPAGPTAKAGQDTYRDIWQFATDSLPTSSAPGRLVVPRSFVVSEWTPLFAALFKRAGVPVHVDTVRESDILRAQSYFRVDTCAPQIGAVGQFLRLAEQPHGMILAPQIEFLPTSGEGLARTCTINQGGVAVARSLAEKEVPGSRIHLFHIDLKAESPEFLAHKLYPRLKPVYRYYAIDMPFDRFLELFVEAMQAQRQHRESVANHAAELARDALSRGQQIALVLGREYILNPGVYDSHVGRLLRDKGLAGIPAHIFDVDAAPEYDYLYWRNAHVIATLADAAGSGTLHKVVRNDPWRSIFKEIESTTENLLPVVQVSTFLCGPDSVTNPLVDQLVNHRPYLRIQSDAAIKELAHLENRMSTYVRQLVETGSQRFFAESADSFDVQLLDGLVNREELDRETDVICFPTMSDNRTVLSVVRSAGFACLENYEDGYDLPQIIQRGRDVVGDSVCAPLAAVYGDILNAVEDFRQRRQDDAAFSQKRRLLIFNNKGLGPCRQGQYVETHKLFYGQHARRAETSRDDGTIRFLVGHENQGFATGNFPRWMQWRGIQAGILQGVLHQLLADGAACCRNEEEYTVFRRAFDALKAELHQRIEADWAPGKRASRWMERSQKVPVVNFLMLYFGCGFYRNQLAGPLKAFRRRWCRDAPAGKHLRFHIDGETYMRTAQFEAFHEAFLEILGFDRFRLTYTPAWSFLDYKLAGMIMRSREGITESLGEIRRSESAAFKRDRWHFLRSKLKRLAGVQTAQLTLRHLLAAPLYRAAGIALPDSQSRALEIARHVIPTRRPGGELAPYVGEAVIKLEKGYDLVLNIAPEGCMVSSMGEVLSPAIQAAAGEAKGKVLPVFSQSGDIDPDQLRLALLKALGPQRLYDAK